MLLVIVLTTAVVGLVYFALSRPPHQLQLYLPEDVPVEVPEARVILTYNGIGLASCLEHVACRPTFISFSIERAGQPADSAEKMLGQRFGCWQVTSEDYVRLPLTQRIYHWLSGAKLSRRHETVGLTLAGC